MYSDPKLDLDRSCKYFAVQSQSSNCYVLMSGTEIAIIQLCTGYNPIDPDPKLDLDFSCKYFAVQSLVTEMCSCPGPR